MKYVQFIHKENDEQLTIPCTSSVRGPLWMTSLELRMIVWIDNENFQEKPFLSLWPIYVWSQFGELNVETTRLICMSYIARVDYSGCGVGNPSLGFSISSGSEHAQHKNIKAFHPFVAFLYKHNGRTIWQNLLLEAVSTGILFYLSTRAEIWRTQIFSVLSKVSINIVKL